MTFSTFAPESLCIARRVVPILCLATLWTWETWRPFFTHSKHRMVHAAHNLAIAVANTVVLGIVFGGVTTMMAEWASERGYGLLNHVHLGDFTRIAVAIILLDGWIYLWHRANHAVPLLWRFHRVHHGDNSMDVTTATRFHLGELFGASMLKIALVPLMGFHIQDILIFDALVVVVTQFHHANISLGSYDRWLRLLLVTPDVHKVHHSDLTVETNTNFATILSLWDRLGRTFHMRRDLTTIVFGLKEYGDPVWQTWAGMWRMPWTAVPHDRPGEDK